MRRVAILWAVDIAAGFALTLAAKAHSVGGCDPLRAHESPFAAILAGASRRGFAGGNDFGAPRSFYRKMKALKAE